MYNSGGSCLCRENADRISAQTKAKREKRKEAKKEDKSYIQSAILSHTNNLVD